MPQTAGGAGIDAQEATGQRASIPLSGVEAHGMKASLLHSWWIPALRGVAAIAFGVLAWSWPGLTLLWLVALFATFALVSGAVAIAGAVRNRKRDDEWWLLLLLGCVGIGAGVIAVMQPAPTATVIVLIIAANALITGVVDIIAAIRLRKTIRGEWLLAFNGVASIVFGVLAFAFPAAAVLALVWLISIYAIVTGIFLLGAAFRLRGWARKSVPERRSTPDRRSPGIHAHP